MGGKPLPSGVTGREEICEGREYLSWKRGSGF